MSERDAFGPNLRRIRMQRGISVLDIVSRTNVNAALWEGLLGKARPAPVTAFSQMFGRLRALLRA